MSSFQLNHEIMLVTKPIRGPSIRMFLVHKFNIKMTHNLSKKLMHFNLF
jgi:hypothetical protein